MSKSRPLRIGTRGSMLARWQAEWVAARLVALGTAVELVSLSTSGDVRQAGPIEAIGTVGVFTKEIQRALLDGSIDLAVHSLKDLPTDPVPGLALMAVPEREDPADALIVAGGATLATLPPGAVVGTGSLRRRTQLWHVRPDLVMRDIRGNVETRLKKLDDGEFDAIVLAAAGLRRLQMGERITELLPASVMLPAIGQGAMGIEARNDDAETCSAVSQLNDVASRAAVMAERALLAMLRGGCMAPVGAWGRCAVNRLQLEAAVLSRDGRQRLYASLDSDAAQAIELGERVARELLDQGAAELIGQSRG